MAMWRGTAGRSMKGKGTPGRRTAVRAAAAVLLFLILQSMVTGCNDKTAESETTGETLSGEKKDTIWDGMLQEIGEAAERSLYDMFMPCILYERSGEHETFWLLQEQIDSLFPLYGYVLDHLGEEEQGELSLKEILLAEAEEQFPEEEGAEALPREEKTAESEQSLEELLKAENEAALQIRESVGFVPHAQQEQVDLESLLDYETLLKRFYIVDSSTVAGSDRLNAENFLARDMSVSKEEEGPQILIFHTHSREGFADSVEGDRSTTIVGVGDRLTQILTDTYGYDVLHHTAEYDTDRNQAYSRALPEIERILKENPSIQVVIDLHRDEMPEETRLVMDLDGRPTARFMFFNGLSRTKKTGNIAYLANENLDGNLAFSFQMQRKAMEYYPGLTRKIYLKGYRYNMHLREKYLLIELGAQNNTLEEALNACDPLAHILDLVLSGA